MGIGGRMGQMGKFCRRDFKGSLELQLPIECIAGTITRPVINILARTDNQLSYTPLLQRKLSQSVKILPRRLHKRYIRSHRRNTNSLCPSLTKENLTSSDVSSTPMESEKKTAKEQSLAMPLPAEFCSLVTNETHQDHGASSERTM